MGKIKMFNICWKQLKELIMEKSNLVVLFIVTIPMILILLFSNRSMASIILTSIVLLLIQLSGKMFANENSEKTIETTLTTPISFSSIYFGKVLCLFVVSLLLTIIISFIFFIKNFVIGNVGADFIYSNVLSLCVMYITAFNVMLVGVNLSFKSSNVIECAIRAPIPLILMSVPYIMLETLLNIPELKNYLIIIYLLYLVISFLITLFILLKMKKYFFKPNAFSYTISKKV